MKKNLIIVCLLLALAAGCATLPEPDLAPAGPSLRVVTYNINWGGPNPERVAKFLLDADADIVCLQETHRQWEAFLKTHLAAAYPHSTFHSSGGAGGIAFMSKRPLSNVRVLSADAGWFPGLIADVATDIGPVQILNVHLRPPLSETGSATVSAYYQSPGVHRKELADFLEAADSNAPLIVAGDFNENEKRGAVKGLLDNGFRDALSLFDKNSKTWRWRVFPGLTLKNRYDHILFSKHFRCTGAKVFDVRASDHLPVLAGMVSNEESAEPSAAGNVRKAASDL